MPTAVLLIVPTDTYTSPSAPSRSEHPERERERERPLTHNSCRAWLMVDVSLLCAGQETHGRQ